MKTLKIFIFLVLILAAAGAKAQFKSADLYVSGLTCSMCSYSTEKSLRTLDFVEDVKPDLNSNLFVVVFKPGKTVSMDAIKAKVKSAGFSVYKLVAIFNFKDLKISGNYNFIYDGDMYHFMNVGSKTLNGDVKITFLDKGFVADDQFKKLAKEPGYQCLKGAASADCPQSTDKQKVYHVTI